jgi:hypothetical protein
MANETANLDPVLRRKPMTAGQALLAVLVAGACGVGLLWCGLPEALSPVGQWDFDAYYYALKVKDVGGNPWEHGELVKMAGGAVSPALYPPHALEFFRLFAFADVNTAKLAFLAAKVCCLAALFPLWLTVFVRPGARGWFLAFAALGYNAALCRDLVVGNVSVFEQTLIWFGVWALLRGRLGAFCLLIILAAQFKVLPIVLLGLVLLTDSPRKWHHFGGSLAVCALIAAGVFWWDPTGSRTFVKLMSDMGLMERGGAIHPCALMLLGDIAAAVAKASDFADELAARRAAYVAYILYALVVVVAFVLAARRRDLRSKVFLGMLTYALIAPRMKDYSYILVLVPTFELVRQRLARGGSFRWLAVGLIGLLALPGLDVLWPYRALLLAGWVWAMSLRGEPRPAAAPHS